MLKSDQNSSRRVDLLRVSPLAPAEQIRAGLSAVHGGVVESRARIERLTRERDAEIAELVDVQHQLHALSFAIARARRGRHLGAGELEGPRRPERDGPPLLVEEEHRPRPSLPPPLPSAPSRDWTAESLRVYALTPSKDARLTLADADAWRRILRLG